MLHLDGNVDVESCSAPPIPNSFVTFGYVGVHLTIIIGTVSLFVTSISRHVCALCTLFQFEEIGNGSYTSSIVI
jgi:hypothetical protein